MAEHAYPAGCNLLASWSRTESAGSAELALPGRAEPLRVVWQGYRCRDGSYTASYFGEQYACAFSCAGRPLLVRESYVDVSITNSGRFERTFEHEGSEGCATELVRALLSGRELRLEADAAHPDCYELLASAQRDHTFHEIEVEDFSCRARFDLRTFTAALDRRRFRDSST